ncbi:MAG: hypothetical protein H6828_03955 [Planctomycetes bacterium]|nr:hypothetical protein [Planctomycetota bacterium]
MLDAVDHVSADLKVPGDLGAPVPLDVAHEAAPADAAAWRSARRAVLGLLRGRDACLKLVLSARAADAELAELLADHAALAPDLPLFLQPVTPLAGVAAPTPARVAAVAERALDAGLVVRVVPQVHRLLGIA